MNIKKENAKKYFLDKDLSNYDFCKNNENIRVDPEAIPSYNCLLNDLTTIDKIKNIYNMEISHFNFHPPFNQPFS